MIIKILKFNESFSSTNEKEEYDELMSKLLHLYSSIPLPKEKASTVIKKIITESTPILEHNFDMLKGTYDSELKSIIDQLKAQDV